jgi:hypothetical protein
MGRFPRARLRQHLFQFNLATMVREDQFHRYNEVLSEARLLCRLAHSVTSIPQSTPEFCDVDCDLTHLRIGEIDRFRAYTRECSMRLIINANASEASQFQALRRHSQSSPLTASHPSRPIHTQEVAGSSPAAPTIKSIIYSHETTKQPFHLPFHLAFDQ